MTENRNPIKPAMAKLLSNFHGVIDRARGGAHNVQERAVQFAEDNALETKLVDVNITFIGASNLPKVRGNASRRLHSLVDHRYRWTSSAWQTRSSSQT